MPLFFSLSLRLIIVVLNESDSQMLKVYIIFCILYFTLIIYVAIHKYVKKDKLKTL